MKRLTPHELQEQVHRLFDGRLVLGDIAYVYANDALQIRCQIHDRSFNRKRKDLLAGRGCPDCAADDRRISAQARFIEKSQVRHGARYDYSQVVYRTGKEPVSIICNVPGHGEFKLRPDDHLRGRGCQKCAGVIPTCLDAFVARSRERHGEGFDYSEVVLRKMRDEVTIICREGHRFTQAPYSHLAGHGCPACVGREKTTEDFIQQARAVHGDRYTYDRTSYSLGKARLEITCPRHGVFTQVASNHLQGRGCPQCGGTQRINERVFLERARAKYDVRYDYKHFIFQGYTVSSTIICPDHGPFQQSPKDHLRGPGCGCPRCSRQPVSRRHSLGRDMFIQKSRMVHGDTYNYDEVAYTSNRQQVLIQCTKHGLFRQSPTSHLKGHGCPRCGRGQFRTQESFIEEASRKHNARYQYSKIQFIDSSTPVAITCPYHGDYLQRPSDHLRGRGCPRCNMSRGEAEVERVLRELGVSFQWQWQSTNAHRALRKLRWDFCILDSRSVPLGLIEFQGEQHFRTVTFGSSSLNDREAAFAGVRWRDQQKKNHALELGVPLLELSNSDLPSLPTLLRAFAEKVGAHRTLADGHFD